MELEQRIQLYMEQNQMVSPGETILAGISGGADSTCLLTVLYALAEQMGFRVAAVHMNHGIRAEAAADADYVRQLCERLQIPFYLIQENIPALAAALGMTEEEAGRKARYEAFEKKADEIGAARIAIAHNRNDLAETMLLNLFRGSGLHGAGGIRPVRGRIIRPLLDTGRQEIEAYLEEKKISYVTDLTNLEDGHTRNRIRHHILSYAQEEINAQAVLHLSQAAQELAQTDDYIRSQALSALKCCRTGAEDTQDMICLDLNSLGRYPELIIRNVFLLCLEQLIPHRKDISASHIALLMKLAEGRDGSAEVNLPCEITAERRYRQLRIGKNHPEKAEGPVSVSVLPGEKSRIMVPGLGNVDVSVFPYKRDQIIPENAYTKWFDYDKIQATLVFRPRKTGDFLVIDDRNNRQSMKKYMINEKIPAAERDIIYVLADGSHILWIPGYRISSFYKVSENTENILAVNY